MPYVVPMANIALTVWWRMLPAQRRCKSQMRDAQVDLGVWAKHRGPAASVAAAAPLLPPAVTSEQFPAMGAPSVSLVCAHVRPLLNVTTRIKKAASVAAVLGAFANRQCRPCVIMLQWPAGKGAHRGGGERVDPGEARSQGRGATASATAAAAYGPAAAPAATAEGRVQCPALLLSRPLHQRMLWRSSGAIYRL